MEALRDLQGKADTDVMVQPKIAVILPCYNESKTIGRVVEDFRRYLPSATIYVYDNNSTDDTVAEAKRAGAVIRHEAMRGKGFVVRRALSQVDADVYVLADGDGTYDASCAPELVERLCSQQLDMVVGVRSHAEQDAYRTGHRFGNELFNFVIRLIFGEGFRDIFSGYRALSRPFVKSFPSLARGFEIETEMSVHALQLNLPTAEIPATYGKRVEGTESKLRTYQRWDLDIDRDPAPAKASASVSTVRRYRLDVGACLRGDWAAHRCGVSQDRPRSAPPFGGVGGKPDGHRGHQLRNGRHIG